MSEGTPDFFALFFRARSGDFVDNRFLKRWSINSQETIHEITRANTKEPNTLQENN